MTEKKPASWYKIILDSLAILVLAVAFSPIFKWYYQAHPPLGLDFYQLPSYAHYFAEHLTLPVISWRYGWFSGLPTVNDYAWLFFYLAIPFVKVWGLTMGSKILLLLTTFFYPLFAYFFLKELSKSRWLALAGSIGLMWTINLYDALFYGGNASFAATQFFLPLVLWLITKYYRTGKRQHFFWAVFFAGLSYWGHAGASLIFVWLPALLFFFFWCDDRVKCINARKIKDCFFYIFASMGIGFLSLYSIAFLVLTVPNAAHFSFFQETPGLKKLIALQGLFVSQNIFLFSGTVLLLVLAVLHNGLKSLRRFMPLMVLVAYLLCFEWLYIIGRNPFGGGIMPARTYWFFSLLLAGLAAVAWNLIGTRSFISRLFKILVVIIILFAPLSPLANLNERVFNINREDIGLIFNLYDHHFRVQSTLEKSLLGDSFWLEDLNIDKLLAQRKITQTDKEKLIGYLIPEWMNPDELNYRFHTLQVGVNIWWSSIFDMPLTHGSYDGSHADTKSYLYWADMAFHGELATHWDHPLSVAKNDLLFLVDWLAIRYLFGEEIDVSEVSDYSLSKSISSASSIATYLTKDPNSVDHKGIKDEERGTLTFFRIKDSAVSPIVKTTNTPTVLVIGNSKTAYNNIIRNFAHLNLNSRFITPIKGPESLNKVSLGELEKFDVVFLQYYQASPKAWEKLEDYVQAGGNLIIETGGEVKESDTSLQGANIELPAVFPIKQTSRGSLGQDWQLTYSSADSLLTGVAMDALGPLQYETGAWNISYAEPTSVKNWAQVVLSQNSKPFLVSGQLGQGRVVWSGLNLSYHYNQYFSAAEGQLIKNILASMIELKDEGTLDFAMERPSPERVIIQGSGFQGAVLKENNYGGWSAKLVSPYKKKLKIYNAGLGYSYVQLPGDVTDPAKVEFRYQGTWFNWLFFILAIIVSFWLIKKSIIGDQSDSSNKRLLFLNKINIFAHIQKSAKEKMASWWDEDV